MSDGSEPDRYERLLAAPGAGRLAGHLAAAARTARATVPAPTPRQAALRDVAAGVAAPMLVAYTLWILADSSARGTARLHFLARDGQVLFEIARRLAPRLHPGIDCRYLPASRQIWYRSFSASTDHGWLWYGNRPTSVDDILRRLCLPGADLEADLARAGFPREGWSRPLDADAAARLRAYLQGPDFAAAAAPARARTRARLVAHLAQEGVLDPVPGAIVDLGWIGSLHDALAGLLEEEGAGPVDCYLFGIEPVKDRTWLDRRRGFLFDLNRGEGAIVFDRIEDQRAFLEVFCAADHGTVTGLRQTRDGRIEAEVDPDWAGLVAGWGLGTVRATIAAFTETLGEALGKAPPERAEIEALRPAIRALLRAFWLTPTRREADAWGAFPFNLGEGHGSYVAPLATPYGIGDLRRVVAGRRVLKKHEHFWIEGALAMSPAPVRSLLLSLRALRDGTGRLRGRRRPDGRTATP